MEIEVWSMSPLRHLGTASSFGEARSMQQSALPDDLKGAYAGIDGERGTPVFYSEFLTKDLREKYGFGDD